MHILQLLTTVDEGVQAIGRMLHLHFIATNLKNSLVDVFFKLHEIFLFSILKYRLLVMEKKLGLCCMICFVMNSASPMIHQLLFMNRRQSWLLLCLCYQPSLLHRLYMDTDTNISRWRKASVLSYLPQELIF